jgi:hypothetical protein
MKKLILVVLGAFVANAGFAQRWDMGSSFNYARPIGGMARNIEQGFGITFEGARVLKNAPFTVGLEFAYNAYGRDVSRQQFTFDDGTVTETNVIVTNSFANLMATGKFFLRKEKLLNPYLSGKIGYSWYKTNLVIEDPEDEDGCKPLDSDKLLVDGTFLASGGAGVRLDFNAVFKNMKTNTLFFDVSAHLTQGGTVEYMNVHNHSSPAQQTPDSDVTARFINNRTQIVHEHHVGHVYSSLVEMMEYRIGVVFRPSCGSAQ